MSLLNWVMFAAEPEDTGGVLTIVRVIAGMGVGGVMAVAFFYLLHKQADNYKEQLKIVRKERLVDIQRMQDQIDLLYLKLGIKVDNTTTQENEE